YVTRQDLRKINSKSSKASRLAKEDMSDYSNCLLGRAAVLGWRKVDDHDHPGLIVKGRPFPFSQDNLDILMTKSLDFSKFVNDVCVDAEMFDLEDEDTIKND
ncbi:MAG: hypothetical protein C0407_19300, partial [Desulfobacca sp.]|nr:hypothetical protein [Desulfobacca sp.]